MRLIMKRAWYYLLSSIFAFSLSYSQPKNENEKFLPEKNKNNLETLVHEDLDKDIKKLKNLSDWTRKNNPVETLYFLRGANNNGTSTAGGILTNNNLFEYGVTNEIRKVTDFAKDLFSEKYFPVKNDHDTNISTEILYLRGIHKERFSFFGNLCEFGAGLNIKGWFYNINRLVRDSVYIIYDHYQKKFDKFIGEPYYVTKSFLDYTELTAGPSIYLRFLPGKFDGDGLFNIRGIIDLNLPIFDFKKRKPNLTFEIGLMIIPPFSRRKG